jgi:signal transduction histidine kinase
MPALMMDIAVGILVAVVLLLFGKYIETRLPYVVWWTVGIAALAARSAIDIALLSGGPPLPILLARNFLILAAAGCFLTGSVARDPNAPGNIVLGAVGYGGLLIAAALFVALQPGGLPAGRVIVGLAAALAFVLAGRGYFHAEGAADDRAIRLIFGALVAIGVNFVAWSMLPRTPGAAGLSELIGALCVAAFGTGIQLRSLERQRALEVMSGISAALHRARHVSEMLTYALRATGEMVQSHSGWVFLEHDGVYEIAATYGHPGPLAANGQAAAAPRQGAFAGPCRCLDLLRAGRLPDAGSIVECDRFASAGVTVRHASVPLRSTGSKGIINLVLPSGRLFTHREMSVVSAIGAQVSLAMDKAQLLDELRDKEADRTALIRRLLSAEEDERKRIARELHDEAGQSLAGLMLELEAARLDTSRGTPVTSDTLSRLRRLAARTVEAVRGLIYDLRPAVLDDLGLIPALRWYTQTQIAARGLQVRLNERLGSERLDPTLETALFRIAQEALWNAVKHASATHVDVDVYRHGERLILRVSDDGRGLAAPPGGTSAGAFGRQGAERRGRVGVGVGGMMERAAALGGTVHVTSRPEGGTEVLAEFPAAAARRGQTA